ncbi:MOSC domain-containing protein [Alkaliphilus hydrothermalis]|uniref:MOSC domain-containing protein YiiM n=1 Tax=Alkaliphilus hydrothermalis TaxID=1482730 RepID=A0ABS2NMQ1_9FIRM|nr:hypothetical protein [Alkaliphilus hydrothermalis]MBM7614219.1 MOSC domain-containing protein YiiM [Alkaliphilus hydrothermalis]
MSTIIGIRGRVEGTILPPSKIEVTNAFFQSKKPHRQVSFISLAGENQLREDLQKGFCHTRFKADFVVEGLEIRDLKVEDQLIIGTAIIEVTEVGKECHDTCPIIPSEGPCGVNEIIFFGRIIKEGTIKIDDKIKIN